MSKDRGRRFHLPGLSADQTGRYGLLLVLTIPVVFTLGLTSAILNTICVYYIGAALFLIPGGYWVLTGNSLIGGGKK